MSSNPSDPHASESDGLQSMLARLRGTLQGGSSEEPQEDGPSSEEPSSNEAASDEQPRGMIPLAMPVAEPEGGKPSSLPVASPVPAEPEAGVPMAFPQEPETEPAISEVPFAPGEGVSPETLEAEEVVEAEVASTVPEPVAAPAVVPAACPICGSARAGIDPSCHDCGYHFPENGQEQPGSGQTSNAIGARVKDRFEIVALINERSGVSRFRGLDHQSNPPRPVVIVRQQVQVPVEAEPVEAEPVEAEELLEGDDILPGFDDFPLTGSPTTDALPALPLWPSVSWEKALLQSLEHPGLPELLDSFTEAGFDYLVEEIPSGRSLWDAWDDLELPSRQRYGYLVQVAETLHALHQSQAMLEGIRPSMVVVSDDGQARIVDLSDLLPLPLPPHPPIRGSLYTAPEILGGHEKIDARADLYSFGAMLYALHVGRELSENDFDRPGHPKPFIPRFPDIHPAYGRLLSKTFRREPGSRFPTDEAMREDPTGFVELIRTLTVVGRTIDLVRLEIASWTNIGMVRTGNEDGYALLHATEARQDDVGEMALILLCDGMGGYEAGEVAAALTIQILRDKLLQHPFFAPLAGKSLFPTEVLETPPADGHAAEPVNVEECKKVIREALREANRQVLSIARAPGSKRRTMGCTAEVVFIDGHHVIVGHVGDSRTYHLHEGRLIQLTRDQTLVNRLVELGTLTPEEAEDHPRRNELQQAIGGQPDVEPGVYHGKLTAGDWVLVCSDGLINHVKDPMIKEMLLSEAGSAEIAARRLVNLTNIEGATDNTTVVVVRAT